MTCDSEQQIYSTPALQLGASCQPTQIPGTRQVCELLGPQLAQPYSWETEELWHNGSEQPLQPSNRAQQLQVASREEGEKCFFLFK